MSPDPASAPSVQPPSAARGTPDPAAGREPPTSRWGTRLTLAAFAIAAAVFIAGPIVWIQWNARDFCPAEIKAKGRSAGTDWEVARSDCGGEIGVVWQVRIIPTKGVSNLAFEARGGGPEPVGYEQKGFEGKVLLAAAPPGETERSVGIRLDERGRPVAPVRFSGGKRVD